MMDCTHYRRAVMADPHDPDPSLREHRQSCHDCNLFTERLLRFDSRLARALRVDLPDQAGTAISADRAATGSVGSTGSGMSADMAVSGDSVSSGSAVSRGSVMSPDAATSRDTVVPLRAQLPRTAPRSPVLRRGWLAMAASVLLAFVVAGALWLVVPGPSLADVVTHMAEEPNAWRRTDVPVPAPDLQQVLRDSHLRLTGGAGMVSYASSCAFRGHQVPHLVIQTESGPVTVMVLVHEPVSKPAQFDEQGYRGVIVPVAGHGSLAVLIRGSAADAKAVEHLAARVLDSIVWIG